MATLAIARPRGEQASAYAAAYAGLGVATLGWTVGFVAGKLALDAMTPLAVAAWRYVLAAAVLLPFAIRRWPASGLRRAAGPLALMVVCGGVLYPWFFLAALARTTAVNTALLVALNPVMTLLLSPLVGERFEARRLAGVGLALAGAVVVITGGRPAALAALSLNPGDLLAIAGALAWATFNLASRGVVAHLTPAVANCVVYSLGAVALYVLGRGEAPWAQLTAAPPVALGGIVAMALLSSVVAGQLFLHGVRTVGVSRTVVFVYLVPVLTAALSAAVLGEAFGMAQAVGGGAVLAGVYWTTRGGPPT